LTQLNLLAPSLLVRDKKPEIKVLVQFGANIFIAER
jgi:hypothetical protein